LRRGLGRYSDDQGIAMPWRARKAILRKLNAKVIDAIYNGSVYSTVAYSAAMIVLVVVCMAVCLKLIGATELRVK
jgi:hypothetical protein